MIDKHHLLECILWPNGDGTFRKIVNTQKRLQELGIYDDYKLTIPIEHGTHSSMHKEFKKGTEHEWNGVIGDKNGMYGRTGKNSPMYGRTGNKNPAWKGGVSKTKTDYDIALKMYREGKISEKELQPYRKAWSEYCREKRSRKKQTEAQRAENLKD